MLGELRRVGARRVADLGCGDGRLLAELLREPQLEETDEFGLPVRYPWAQDYRGKALVVYGHTPVPEPNWVNGTICIDTGCVFGGWLTALRYPERDLVSVPARRVYYRPAGPLAAPAGGAGEPEATRLTTAAEAQAPPGALLEVSDLLGTRGSKPGCGEG